MPQGDCPSLRHVVPFVQNVKHPLVKLYEFHCIAFILSYVIILLLL